jgi:hypothetical protein
MNDQPILLRTICFLSPKEGISNNHNQSESTPWDNWPEIPKLQKEHADLPRQVRVEIKDIQKIIAQWTQDDNLTLREVCTSLSNLLIKPKTLEKVMLDMAQWFPTWKKKKVFVVGTDRWNSKSLSTWHSIFNTC